MSSDQSQSITNWYAVYTKPRWEKKVATLLGRAGIEHYCPLNRVLRQWSDRKKLIDEPLFSCYIFVRVGEIDKWRVKEIDGVLNYVYWLGKPATVANKEIDLIRSFLKEYHSIEVVKSTQLKINDQVRINSGPFINKEAEVINVKGNRVEVQIASMNLTLKANLQNGFLTLV